MKTIAEIAAMPIGPEAVQAAQELLRDWLDSNPDAEDLRGEEWHALMEGPLGEYVLSMPLDEYDAIHDAARKERSDK